MFISSLNKLKANSVTFKNQIISVLWLFTECLQSNRSSPMNESNIYFYENVVNKYFCRTEPFKAMTALIQYISSQYGGQTVEKSLSSGNSHDTYLLWDQLSNQ